MEFSSMSCHILYFVVRTFAVIPPTDIKKHKLSMCSGRELQKVTDALLCACAHRLRKPGIKLRVHGAISHVFCPMRSLFKVERERCLYRTNIREDAHTWFVFNV